MEKNILFTFVNFGVSQFVFDGPSESFVVYTLDEENSFRNGRDG